MKTSQILFFVISCGIACLVFETGRKMLGNPHESTELKGIFTMFGSIFVCGGLNYFFHKVSKPRHKKLSWE